MIAGTDVFTTPASSPPAHAFFLDGDAGPLFAVHFRPPPERYAGRDVLVLPPLGDEMNKSRRMLAAQARALNAAGAGMLMVDLYGTGDSAGDFRDARWPTWLRDVQAALDWLADGGGRLGLIGLRMGALFLPHLLGQGRPIDHVALWQPVMRGDLLLTQFLRLRAAASSMQNGSSQETAATLRDTLSRGQSVEVAGYELSPELARSLEEARLADAYPLPCPPVSWYELVPEALPAAPAPSQSFAAEWRRAGTMVSLRTVTAAPFWTGQQITVVPELARRTTEDFDIAVTHERDPDLLSLRR